MARQTTMEKYQGKYRIPSARMPQWDYGWAGAYFITICTAGRQPYFGAVENQVMVLSDIGQIATTEWLKTPALRPDMHITLDAFVVMPNHFHAIVIIGENQYNSPHIRDEYDGRGTRRDAMHRVPTDHPTTTSPPANHFAPQSKNLASVVRGFKSAVTVQARQINAGFGWQPRYHDHIIRNQPEFRRIQHYIIQNPAQWAQDKFHYA